MTETKLDITISVAGITAKRSDIATENVDKIIFLYDNNLHFITIFICVSSTKKWKNVLQFPRPLRQFR